MANLVILTQKGLDQCNEAHNSGKFVDIAYYVPSYDMRIDPNVSPIGGADRFDISTVTDQNAEHPIGEVLWRKAGSSYSLSADSVFVKTSAAAAGTDITGYFNKVSMSVNVLDGVVVNSSDQIVTGEYYTATDGYFDTTANMWKSPGSNWELLDNSTYEPADPDLPESSYLYRGVTYNSVISSGTDKRANFRVTISNIGNAKFNVVSLYGAVRDASDLIETSPYLFAMVILPEPQYVDTRNYAVGTGNIGSFVLDFQLDSIAVPTDFDNIFYSTSADYWQRVSNNADGSYGLAYPGDVYISNRLAYDDKNYMVVNPEGDTGVSKLLVATFENINASNIELEKTKPQLCLQHATAPDGTTASKRIRTTFRTTSAGNCEVDFYGACINNAVYSITPKDSGVFGLGTSLYPWKKLYLSDYFGVTPRYAGGGSGSDSFEVIAKGGLDSGSVTTNMSVAVTDKYINGTKNNRFVNANVIGRLGEDLYLRSSYTTSVVSGTAQYDADNDMYILAGNVNVPSQKSVASLGSLNASISDAIINLYKKMAAYNSDQWVFGEMAKKKGRMYLSSNDHIYIMGSAVFLENPIPAADLILSLGVEDDGNGKAKAFGSVVTNRIVNRGRTVYISSDFIPLLQTAYEKTGAPYTDSDGGWMPSLGTTDSRFAGGFFSFLYSYSLTCPNISTSAITAEVLTSPTIKSTNITNTGVLYTHELRFDYLAGDVYNYKPVTFNWTGFQDGSETGYFKDENMTFTVSSLTMDPLGQRATLVLGVNFPQNIAKADGIVWTSTDRKAYNVIARSYIREIVGTALDINAQTYTAQPMSLECNVGAWVRDGDNKYYQNFKSYLYVDGEGDNIAIGVKTLLKGADELDPIKNDREFTLTVQPNTSIIISMSGVTVADVIGNTNWTKQV